MPRFGGASNYNPKSMNIITVDVDRASDGTSELICRSFLCILQQVEHPSYYYYIALVLIHTWSRLLYHFCLAPENPRGPELPIIGRTLSPLAKPVSPSPSPFFRKIVR